MTVYPLEVGDIFTTKTPEEALESMILLHKYGIESCLHSYFNGAECTALEIIFIPEDKKTVYEDEAVNEFYKSYN